MDAVLTEKINRCYQCGKCSTGCPVSEFMDMLPHQVVHALGLGMEERVLRLRTPWLCAGCYTCAARCPNDIDVTAVMGYVREKAMRAGVPCPCPEILRFHNHFLRDMSRRGRVHETRMMGEFNLLSKRPFKDVSTASKMALKGRLPLLSPKKLRGFSRWARKVRRS